MKELAELFSTKGFLPQGQCIAWMPGLLSTYSAADILIGAAYYSIPLGLVYLARKRRDLSLRPMFLLFGAFLVASGTVYFIDLATLWRPVYWFDAGARAVTAAMSVLVVVALWPFVRRAIALPSRHEIEVANLRLERELVAHRRAEQDLQASEERFRQLAETLERRVAERGAEFEATHLLLEWEIGERRRAEAQLQQANALLKEALAMQGRHATELAQLNQLNQMASLMQTCRTETEVYAVVARFASDLLEARSGAVFALNRTRNVADAGAVWGEVPAEEQTFAAIDCWALRRSTLHPQNKAQADIGCPHMRSPGARQHTCAPFSADGELLGVLHLRGRVVPVDERERALLAMVTERIALAIASLKQRENLTRQSVRDALTGLFNRRYLEEFLALEERRGLRTGRSIGIVMVDLDRFKEVNDTHGHEAGDEVLRRVASVLQEQTRSGDIPCRYGGEEFLLVLPGASLEVTLQRAEQLRAMLEAQEVAFRGNPIGLVTASVGVAAFPESGTSVAEALAAADRALYLAKQNGRNRVECEELREVA